MRDYNEGALQALVLGAKGSGKSTLLAHLAYAGLENGDIVIWRGRSRDFWPRFEPELVKVFVHEHDDLSIWKIKHGTNQKQKINDNYEIIRYKNLNEIMKQLEPAFIHVLYEPTWTRLNGELLAITNLEDIDYPGTFWWYNAFHFLAKRVDARWISLIIDEIDDIVPSGTSGPQWRLIETIQHALSEFREKFISLYGSTHDPGHVDFRVLRKFSAFIYLKGSIVPKFSMMKYKTSTVGLKKGRGTIEILGEGYGGFTFTDIRRDGYSYAIEKVWKGPAPRRMLKKKRGLMQEILELAKEAGSMKALEKLNEIREKGEVSERHYHRIKSKLRLLQEAGG